MLLLKMSCFDFLADRTVRRMTGYWHNTVDCLRVCSSVTLYMAAKRYILQQKMS